MIDMRMQKLAKTLVTYSINARHGEKVLIEATDIPAQVVEAIVDEVYAAKALPFVNMISSRVQRSLLIGTDETHMAAMADYDKYRMRDMDCYIGIRGSNNSFELSDVTGKNMSLYSTLYAHPVHHELRVDKTKWVVLRWCNEGMSQLAGKSTKAFEDYYYDVCTLDYAKMDAAMTPLVELLNRTDKVRIVAPNTDLSFSIKGIPAVKCSGRRNIPDGEVYTAPILDSVNGTVSYNTPSNYQGEKFENVKFTFKDGKIILASGNKSDKINRILDTDEGARRIGEFALGVNPLITEPMGDILFDEKIRGSIHFTPGSCYREASNGNVSAIHWDLVLMMDKASGGGEIYFDNILIRKDGLFTLPILAALNPN